MRSLLTFLAFLLVSIFVDAQVFNTIVYYDKSDKVLKTEQRQTRIQQTDSTIIISEYGKQPVTYHIDNNYGVQTKGSKDKKAYLSNGTYGYETSWYLIRDDMMTDYSLLMLRELFFGTDNGTKQLAEYLISAYHQFVTDPGTHSQHEYFWLYGSPTIFGGNINTIVYY